MARRKDVPCVEKRLPEELRFGADMRAIDIFPANAPFGPPEPGRIIGKTQKFWGARVKDLTVGFMEPTSGAMRDKVLLYANRWGEFSSARFRWTQTDPVIRIAFGPGGYYSYLGTDCLSIPRDRHTMNLQGFTVRTSDSEWERVPLHEFGHALGLEHEQQRREILDLLDERKTILYFMRTQGWSESEVRQQVLDPLDERQAQGSPHADQRSIMAYNFPASITKNGQPIPGGNTFSPTDKEYFAKIYPPDNAPPPPVTPEIATLVGLDVLGREVARFKR